MKWIANVSDGQTYIEGQPVPGERTSWQQFLKMIKDGNLKITGLSLQVEEIIIRTPGNKVCDGYFHAYEVRKAVFSGGTKELQGIGTVIGNQVFITWISLALDPDGTRQIYNEIRPLNDVKIHTTLS